MRMHKAELDNLLDRQKNLINDLLADNAPDFLKKHADLLDDYFYSIFSKSIAARKMTAKGIQPAVVALGGFGRKEQCIHSDIDLLILFKSHIPYEAEAFVQELIYPLWDAGFEVGYAVRTIKECIDMSFERFDILTTVLDARFICGASLIYMTFMEKFRAHLTRKRLRHVLEQLLIHTEKRLDDFGDSTYLLSPNIKSGFGGLRDYHTLLWYAKITADIKTARDLEYYGFLTHEEFALLTESLNFIWHIRNRLHHITRRKCDQLHFEYQKDVARLMGYRSSRNKQAVEQFLGDLHSRMEFLKQMNQITVENIRTSGGSARKSTGPRPTRTAGIVIRKRRLHFANTVVILQQPELLIRIFHESGKLKIPLSIEATRVASEFSHLVDARLIRDKACIDTFKKILALSFWEFNVLRIMLFTGILQKFIPEFSAIENKIQYNHYHLFPVDIHSIRCVQVLNSFREKGADPMKHLYHEVFREIRNKSLLLMVGLLHDIGKSDPAKEHSRQGAKIAARILNRMGFPAADIHEAVFLIENHLFMVITASRRDISDEETAVFCASRIGKVKLLRMLYLISVADSMATGPKAWNPWTENLLKELFLKTLNILKKGELATKRTEKLIQKKKEQILAMSGRIEDSADVEKYIAAMSRRYLLYVSPSEIIGHLALRQQLGDKDFVWDITREKNPDIRTVSVCGLDKPGFYSKLAGVFFLNSLDIVASQAYSWGPGIAMDIFKVKAPRDPLFEEEKWRKTRDDLARALGDDQFLSNLTRKIPKTFTPASGQRIMPNTVEIDNSTSSFFTIIEVHTYDFPGLLFALTNALYRNGVDFRVAMIATKVDQVIDVFYVRDIENEQKIESEGRLEAIKTAIIDSLPQIIDKEAIHEKN